MQRSTIAMRPRFAAALCAMYLASSLTAHGAASQEANPIPQRYVSLGPEGSRFIVGFKTLGAAAVTHVTIHRSARSAESTQAATTAADMSEVAAHAGLEVVRARQLTPSLHSIRIAHPLYGADLEAALARLRADARVEFAEVDQRRFVHAVPNDPLFVASTGSTGQWYLGTPGTTPGSDLAATDTVSAWAITTGSTGTVIADVDTGVRFDHPDLGRAGLGGRLLPGYDFIGQDYDVSSGKALGTYLIANDGDGVDPDPSDPGDWLSAADEQNALFPVASCGKPADSSWHGTRVMGILGASTDNAIGIAGVTWKPFLLPVRALGKCGGYDSDIIAGMQWAAGLSVNGVPNNPYPADIVNLSLGGKGACPSSYVSAIKQLTSMGVLIVASAGNESGAVDTPANCGGVLAVAGLRNTGTKVGYSSSGPEVSVAAPAGNCVQLSGACLRSIDTTSNAGLTTPTTNVYTNQTNPNLGTSFSAPIVAGIAALMHAVNANLTPAELIARIKSSATAFPQPVGVPVCGAAGTDPTVECTCPNDGSQCGAGMVNALQAVTAAQRPIAAVAISSAVAAGNLGTLDASSSAAACGRSVAAYGWKASGGVTLQPPTNGATVTVVPTGAAGTVTLTVTDSNNATDTALIAFAAGSATSTAPSNAGSAASACPAERTVSWTAPTVSATFSPASVAPNAVTVLTLTLSNANASALTESSFTAPLPNGVVLPAGTQGSGGTSAPATTCAGHGSTFSATASGITLSNAIIPASGSCTISVPVESATAGTYTATIAAGALSTATAGPSTAGASASLNVNAPSHGGGGEIDGWDALFVIGVILAGRRGVRRLV